MNVYHKQYKPEFINELPVNFNKYKEMDLTYIPVEYHGLFTTDWNWGKYSTMSMDRRMIFQELYLEYSHNVVKAQRELNKPIKEEIMIGFPKD